jgi:type VI secretion system protein ImpL
MHKHKILWWIGVLIFVCVVGALTAVAIYFWSDRLNLVTLTSKIALWMAAIFFILCALQLSRFAFLYPILKKYFHSNNGRSAALTLSSSQNNFPALFSIRHREDSGDNGGELNYFKELTDYLKRGYGYLWWKKVRILIVTGKTADVERLTPGLVVQRWQEDKGTVLLWGGDLNVRSDIAWFRVLYKMRRRPADGIVWVTSGLDGSQAAKTADAMDSVSHALTLRYNALGWKLPLYVWSLHPHAGEQAGRIIQSVGCLLPAGCTPPVLAERLAGMIPPLLARGIEQVCAAPQHHFLLTLADQLTRRPESVTGPLSLLLNPYRPLPLAGVMFSPPSPEAARSVPHHWGKDARWDALLDSLPALPAGLRPRKSGFCWLKTAAVAAAALMLLGGGMMTVSFIANRSLVATAGEQLQQAAAKNLPPAARLQALSGLQRTLARLEYRAQHGVPWYSRGGLSQNGALRAALLPRYGEMALPLLRDAAAAHLSRQLRAFVQLPPDSPRRSALAGAAYDQLKLYLMLARPGKMEAAWFSRTLMREWPRREGVTDGLWQGSGPSLLAFYGTALAAHPGWRLPADEALVSQARTLLIRLTGMRNSESTLYQKMLAQVANQYADMRLADMTGDTDVSRLFTTDTVIPGMFTRQAWEQAVQPAIEKVVAARRDEMDWVLSDTRQSAAQPVSAEALRARLTERYFADFSGVWLEFLNGLRWQKAETLSEAIDQLILVADVRQSPLVALMNTLSVQGRTGQSGNSLPDSLVKSAQALFNGDERPAIDRRGGPLDATFGPVLALMAGRDGGGQSGLSLQTWLTRVTQVRLRLQQITNATDPQAMTRQLAQTVFQGKAIDLTETRDYGSLIAAGLGQEWSGFGQTVFVRPMEQAWQQVLTPAAESLNARWRSAVVEEWNSAFGGRYPFRNVSSDVSLPLLAKYLNGDSGRITRFLQTRLNGVLHKEGSRWTADSINGQGLTFNPEFMRAINTLSHIADVAFADGGAGLHFELRPGTAAGVMQTDLMIDGQKLSYMNQMPVWKRFRWPADTEAPGASLSWISTEAGTRGSTRR